MELEVTSSIDAPADAVWRVLADVERWPEWTPTITKIERLDSGPLGVGSRVRIVQPKLRPGAWTVEDWVPGEGFTWVLRSPGVRVVAGHSIRPEGRGCSVELRVRYEGILGGIVRRLYSGLTEKYMKQEAEGLRVRSENHK
jgi:carbon monoxide dehydrogenase subunit G